MKATIVCSSLSSPLSPSTAHATLLGRGLATYPASPRLHSTRFLTTLTPMAGTHLVLFSRLSDLLHLLLPPLLAKEYDAGPTPTVARLFPGGGYDFRFPPPSKNEIKDDDGDSEENEKRQAALRLMVSPIEARPSLVKATISRHATSPAHALARTRCRPALPCPRRTRYPRLALPGH